MLIDPSPPEPVLDALEALGVRLSHRRKQVPGLVLEGCADMSGTQLVASLAAQLRAGAEAKAPVCAFVREQRKSQGVDALGAIRLEHLGTYRAAYGAAREGLVRQALHELVERTLRQRAPRDGVAWVGLETGALFAGAQALVDDVLHDIGQAYPAIARLYYRKQDRDQGFVDVAGERSPLVGVTLRRFASGAVDNDILEALGLGAPCALHKS